MLGNKTHQVTTSLTQTHRNHIQPGIFSMRFLTLNFGVNKTTQAFVSVLL